MKHFLQIMWLSINNLSQHAEYVHQKSENIICTECNKYVHKRYVYISSHEIISLKRTTSYIQLYAS